MGGGKILAGFAALSLFSIAPACAQSANALLEKGIDYYGQGGHLEDSLATYNKLINRFSNSEDPEAQEDVAKALYNKGVVLVTLHRYKEALETCDELLRRYGDAQDPSLQRDVANALYSKGNILYQLLDKHKEAKTVFRDIATRFSGTIDPQIENVVHKAKIYLVIH